MIKSPIKQLLILLIKAYSRCISIFLPDTCRFYPSCSSYAAESINKFGFFYASSLIIKRIFSCHPFNKKTGYDPVP